MAGTTKSTVDKVIHKRPGVSEKKRQEIKKFLKEHGYEANPLAKALNYQKRKMKVAVVLPQITAAPDIKGASPSSIRIFTASTFRSNTEVGASDAEAQAACIRQLAEENVSGALILPIRSAAVEEAIGELLKKKIPVVIVNSELQLDGILCYVGQNMLQSGSVAVRMMDLFLKEPARIGIISCHNMLSHEQRERSFVESLAQGSEAAGSEVLKTRYIEETRRTPISRPWTCCAMRPRSTRSSSPAAVSRTSAAPSGITAKTIRISRSRSSSVMKNIRKSGTCSRNRKSPAP